MLSLNNRDKLPKSSGIYRVLDSEHHVIYVGQAKNIHSRWNQKHHKLDNIKDHCNGKEAFIDWVLIPENLLNRAENCAVNFYDPILNQQTPPLI